jgi:putative ATP-dependent endonuclease of the OLD family
MKLRSVHVKNFRCLNDVTVDMGALTVLLGPNSAGKSSLLHALAFFFEGHELEQEDVFEGNNDAVTVECVFDTLSDADRTVFGPYATGNQMVLRRSWRPGEDQKMTGRGRRFPGFADVKNSSGRERTAAYKALGGARPDLDLPAAKTIAAVDQAMLTFEQDHPELCEIVDDENASQLFGYKAVGKSKLVERFPFVFVPAMRDAVTEATERRGSLLSRLLTAVAEQRAAANEGLKAIETDARTKYEDAIATTHGPVLDDLGDRISTQLRRYVPSAQIKLEPTASGFSIEPPRVELRGGEEHELTDLSRQGHGFQRAFVISVLEYLADTEFVGEGANKPTLFLAIEEPELYQHPPRARHFFRTLSTVADSTAVQVCYATHSPYFVSPEQFDAIRIFRRLPGDAKTNGAAVTAASLDVVVNELPSSETREPRAYLARTLSEQFREAFFAKSVLLVEGPTDVAVFETAADLLGHGSFAAQGIVITHVGGKGSQPIALAILAALGIPTFCVFDADADASDGKACETCARAKRDRTAAIRSNRRILRALAATEEEFPSTQVDDMWACFHTEIEDSVTGLRELLAVVGNEMGWKRKSPEVYREAVRRAGEGALPDELRQIIKKTRRLAGLASD